MTNPLLIKAIKKADHIRSEVGLNMSEPLNIFDCCVKLGITVRFVDINMEGMYISHEDSSKSNILVSAQRPLPRRIYTCAHELGHHVFSHGTKIDALTDESSEVRKYDADEFLVDVFAGVLLMPVLGVQAEFIKRGWLLEDASPLQFYTISSVFGVGYQTLITHCKMNRLLSDSKVVSLLKLTPGKILESIVGASVGKSHFKIIDKYVLSSVIDLEVSNLIMLPLDIKVEGTHLEKVLTTTEGNTFVAKYSGITRAFSEDFSKSYFIRIQKIKYVGLVENRHLDN